MILGLCTVTTYVVLRHNDYDSNLVNSDIRDNNGS